MTTWSVSNVRLHAAIEDYDWLDLQCKEVVEQDHEWGTKIGADGTVARFVAQQAALTIRGMDAPLLKLDFKPVKVSFLEPRTGKRISREVGGWEQRKLREIFLPITGEQPLP